MMFKNPNPVGGLGNDSTLDARYYEEVGDPLAPIRNRMSSIPNQNTQNNKPSDPFVNDPDWQQHLREERSTSNQPYNGW